MTTKERGNKEVTETLLRRAKTVLVGIELAVKLLNKTVRENPNTRKEIKGITGKLGKVTES